MNVKRMIALVLALLSLTAALSACGGEETAETGSEAVYQVAVADASGTPYTSGIIVRFLQNGEQVAMQAVDENGMVTKELPRGEYAVELVFTGDESEYYYDPTGLTLTAEAAQLTVVLAYTQKAEPVTLYVDGEAATACPVGVGSTYVDLAAGRRNYFLFEPTIAGTYEFTTSDPAAAIGYYGAPHFVQSLPALETVDNVVTISVHASSIGSSYVIGIDTESVENCILDIARVGEPAYSIADEPWTVYAPTVELSAYTLPEGAVLKDFDLTASTGTYNLVLNESDGFYHLDSADGPLVLVYLGVSNSYLDSYKTILENTGVVKYFYDADGNFEKRENYTNCLLTYLEYMDEDAGVYPLTEDLKYIIRSSGEHAGWYDEDGMSYIFLDVNNEPLAGINPEISWLFMCCYIAQ